jgi:hypothetical protein
MKPIVDYVLELYKEEYKLEPDSDNEIHEFIDCEMKKVWSGDHDKHRWYTIYWAVYELPDGRYIRMPKVDCNEGQDYYECLDFSRDDIVEVFPKQVISTIYVTEKPEKSTESTFIDMDV